MTWHDVESLWIEYLRLYFAGSPLAKEAFDAYNRANEAYAERVTKAAWKKSQNVKDN